MENEYQEEEEEYNQEYDYDYDYDDEVDKHEIIEKKPQTEIVTKYGTWRKQPSKPYKWESKPWAELTGFQRAMIRSRKFDDAQGWGCRWVWIPHKTPEVAAPSLAPVQKKPVFSYKMILQKDEKADPGA